MSNTLSHELLQRVHAAEESQANHGGHGPFGQLIHLMPPTGWLNDPNGLCQKDDIFHAFFQYAPLDATGGLKFWGHYTSQDMTTWEYQGCPLTPDEPIDKDGVYSGSALVEDNCIRVLYTGNVKLPNTDESYDYINAGREAHTILIESTDDGMSFGPKHLVMNNTDYPSDLTCHVRDPKVWSSGDTYFMVQGARRRVEGTHVHSRFEKLHGEGAGRDVGEILVFESPDLHSWTLVNRITTPERFGFMWECPDYFELTNTDGSNSAFLSCSPQGLEGGEWTRRNIYASGYFPFTGDIAGSYKLSAFRLWDAGFDFYAPQTFNAEDGRRILIGWMGIPDELSYDNQPTVNAGWQHCFTIPREITLGEDGTLLQAPVREIEKYHGLSYTSADALAVEGSSVQCFDMHIASCTNGFSALFAEELTVEWKPAEGELPNRLEMRFVNNAASGRGRTVRWEPLDKLQDIRIIGDASSIEVFANKGSLVMSTRYYPASYRMDVKAQGASIELWPIVIQ